jgi:hypothetical protein
MADDFKKAVGKGFKGTKKEVKEERVSTKPIRGGKKGGRVPGFMKEIAASGSKGVTTEMAEERKGEPARKAGGMSARPLTREMTRDEKAAELTRKMKKGYRKGYRVGKRPRSRNSSGR